ncbi:MAG TPA: hypothetical protein PK080_00165 [Hyphomonadaceae bacterium]|nr:hypothetical protein [Hyphomonadaceae bacterium]
MTINARITLTHRETGARRDVGKASPRALIAAVRLTMDQQLNQGGLVFDHTAQRWTIQRKSVALAPFHPAIWVGGVELADTTELRDLREAVRAPWKLTSWVRGQWACPTLGGRKLTELATAVLATADEPAARAA